MDVQQRYKAENDTASRIKRIREAFAEARNDAGLADPPEEFSAFSNWGNWLNR